MKRIYLDYAATTPADPQVVRAMEPYFTQAFGNPLSSHGFAAEARKAVAKARKSLSSLLGAGPGEIVFTSGGTESNNAALKGAAYANRERGGHIVTSAVEHESILETCSFLEKEGFSVTYLPVDEYGLVEPEEVRKAIDKGTILISIMHGNNEIGTIEPIDRIGKIARSAGVRFHTDAVQTFGHVPFSVKKLKVDLLSLSGHKIYGPKGVGALYVRRGTPIVPFMHGGAHEDGRRASTLNVPGIVGLGKAAELAGKRMAGDKKTVIALRRRLIEGISRKIRDAKLNGHPSLRLPGNVSFSFPGADGDLLLRELDRRGIACSTGSACHEPAAGPSHVLSAIGLPEELRDGTLRFSLGRHVKEEDIDFLLDVLPGVVRKARSLSEFLD